MALPDLEGSVQSLSQTMQAVSDSYALAEQQKAHKAQEYNGYSSRLAEIQEELDDPGPNTDGPQLQHEANRLKKKMEKAFGEYKALDSRQEALHANYYQVLKPQMDGLQHVVNLTQEATRRHDAEHDAQVTSRVSGYKTSFHQAFRDVAAQEDLIPAELKDEFLGTEAAGFQDGWINRYALSQLRQLPDGRYTTISDPLGFTRAAAKVFVESSRRTHAAWGAHFAKKGNGAQPPAAGAPAPSAHPATPEHKPSHRADLQERVEEDIDAKWEAAGL